MGTKNKPGKYDCHNKAGDDEPIFTFRAKDPTSSDVVENWVVRNHDLQPKEKLEEALHCANAMRKWRLDRENEATTASEGGE